MTTVDPTNTTPVDPNAVSLTINGKIVSARKGDLIILLSPTHGASRHVSPVLG
jgi:predicted fused transcriptional regulator/phosphomethylpyrimidine kinase